MVIDTWDSAHLRAQIQLGLLNARSQHSKPQGLKLSERWEQL